MTDAVFIDKEGIKNTVGRVITQHVPLYGGSGSRGPPAMAKLLISVEVVHKKVVLELVVLQPHITQLLMLV